LKSPKLSLSREICKRLSGRVIYTSDWASETGAEMGFVEMHFDLVGPATDFAVFNVFLLQTRRDIDFHHNFATTVGAIKLS
jgi:hypothetical protein